jgi:hypothetical protein
MLLWRHNEKKTFFEKIFFSVDFSKKKFVSKIAYIPGPSSKNLKFDIFYVKVA